MPSAADHSLWSADDVSVPTDAMGAKLQGRPLLDAGVLDAFGGVGEVVQQLQAAPSSEARSNLFCVLFDDALAQLQQVRRPAAVDGTARRGVLLGCTGKTARAGGAVVELDTAHSGVACDPTSAALAFCTCSTLQTCVEGLASASHRCQARLAALPPLMQSSMVRRLLRWTRPTCAR